ncbi:hypothetical protein [Streptomyces sp. NRRL S-241]|uniref:hypothetical protein n=1 Tax=Streptomyces sp. NRRL S-241 TaxID=1463896 RepID=UPI0004C23CDA|nr:hypothetical protein [Streptomyces sp. NRRL S-241]
MPRSHFTTSDSVLTRVTIDDENSYAAVVDPTNRWNGWVSPYLPLDSVRQLSADRMVAADKYGHATVDTIHVVDGGVDLEGAPSVVVLHIRWQYILEEGPVAVTSVIAPTEDGLYGIGGWEWTWSISTWDCACSSWYYHEADPCPNCGGERPAAQEQEA